MIIRFYDQLTMCLFNFSLNFGGNKYINFFEIMTGWERVVMIRFIITWERKSLLYVYPTEIYNH